MKKIIGLPISLVLVIAFSLTSCVVLKQGANHDNEITRLTHNLPPAESYPDADIIHILREKIVEVFKDKRCKVTSHSVYKILNERGKDYAEVKISYNSRTEKASILSARTMTPDGRIISLKANATKIITPFKDYPSYSDYKELVFSMPGVTVGSIIEYEAVVEEEVSDIKGAFSDSFDFQKSNPTLLCRYKIVMPQDVHLKYLPLNPLKSFSLSPKILSNGSRKVYLWEYQNTPQIIAEDSMPPMEEVAFRILVTTMESWDEFFTWQREKIKGKTEPDRAIKEKVAELTKNLTTPKEKLEAIFNYVKREIRYVSIDLGKSGYEPQSAPEIFENKYGDCKDKSTLLITMLKVAGIPAYYVLIPTNDLGNLIKDFHYPFQFNHCIVAVQKESDYQFLDPVGEDYRANYLPYFDQNRNVLIFKERETIFAKTPLAKVEENAAYHRYRMKIAADGSMECEGRTIGFGDVEAVLRAFYNDNSPAEVKAALEKSVNKNYNAGRLVEYSHSDPMNFKEDFSVRMIFNSSDYCKKAGDMMICPLVPPKTSCSSAGKGERRYPLVNQANLYIQEEMEFDIPENHEVYYLPEPVEIINQYFSFRSHSQRNGKNISYRREFIEKATSITPEEYPAYRNLCQEMEKSLKRDVLFKTKK